MKRRYYSQNDVLMLGKRINNPKRSYLLVNPLQAKHIPVSPAAAIEMMSSLGRLVRESSPGKCLVIGFAETATAVATVVSMQLDTECLYIQTTREDLEEVQNWVEFSEEHSHATEQKLCGDGLRDWIAVVDHIVVVDDEFSTGKTLINIAKALKAYTPDAHKKDYVAVSIVNRIDEEHVSLLAEEGYRCVYLVKPADEDYEKIVSDFQVHKAETISMWEDDSNSATEIQLQTLYQNPRMGVSSREYTKTCDVLAEEARQIIQSMLVGERILVIGTEECMYPALAVGKRLEEISRVKIIRCHATTRSPIGISEHEGYPIQNGCRLRSFYDSERITYLYNLREYDMAVIVTDARKDKRKEGLHDLCTALKRFGCRRIICLGIGE